jgi:excisionase family DNA binding protein
MDLQNKKILSFKEGAKFLGFSESYTYKLTMNRKLPFSRPNNGKIYFSRERLENWMLGNPDKEETNFIKKQTA